MTLDRNQLSGIAAIWKRQRRQLVARFGGTSMLPSIEPGTELTIDCGRTPQLGDVVLAVAPTGLIVHRLVIVHGELAVMCGDGTVIPDPAVPLDALFGVVSQKRAADRWIDLPPPPRSFFRALFRAIARWSLRFGYRVNHHVSRILWLGRRAFFVAGSLGGSVEVENDGDGNHPERK